MSTLIRTTTKSVVGKLSAVMLSLEKFMVTLAALLITYGSLFYIAPVEASVIVKNVYMSETTGTILLNGEPVVGARVVRKVTRPKVLGEGEPYVDETLTDSAGKFSLPEVTGNTWFFRPQLFSANPFSDHQIILFHDSREILIWTSMNGEFEFGNEFGFTVLDIACDLSNAQFFSRTNSWFVRREDIKYGDKN